MKLVVIGGVAAGASLAARVRRLDEKARIVVLEKSGHVSFANCGLPYHLGGVIKERPQLLVQTPESLKASLNIEVRVGHEAISIDRAGRRVVVKDLTTGGTYEETYDLLALCPGARPLRPPLPGADHPRICVLRTMEDMDAVMDRLQQGARSAVIVGGGYVGVELAENLACRGLRVTLIEMLPRILPTLDGEMVRPLEKHLQAKGVELLLGTAARAFRESEGRLVVELQGERELTADTVILAAGVKPDVELAAAAGLELGPRGGIKVDPHMRTSDPSIYAAGDALEVCHTVLPDSWLIPLAGPANRQGRVAADNICGRSTVYKSTQGTAIVKVFDMTAAVTGATEKSLRQAGIPYAKVYLHPFGHARYYPGSAAMAMKVLFAPEGGRLLGAQIVGFDGVDKRIDVLATALRAGMTVFDLQELELAYAPPFGAAKDPVNMAGFLAANYLNGDVKLWYAEEFPSKTKGALIIDVSTPAEYKEHHIPGALNIWLGSLRRSLSSLPAGQPIRLYCKVGFRSYLAYRILVQTGFSDVAMLAGGIETFAAWHGQEALLTGASA